MPSGTISEAAAGSDRPDGAKPFDGPKASGSVTAMAEGQELTLPSVDPGSEPIRIRCQEVSQRNWSRVAVGDRLDGSGQVFLKQYVDGSGTWQRRHWQYEWQGSQLMGRILKHGIKVPAVLASSESGLVNAFEYRQMVSFDVLLRVDPSAFERLRPALLSGLRELVDAFSSGPSEGELPDLPVKERPYGTTPSALIFKGLDVRNLGVGTDSAGEPGEGLYMFDIGRPYFGPIEEAAAKLLISVGLLNWGRPLSRFRLGPDVSLLADALKALRPFLDGEALEAELERESAFRLDTPQARNMVERVAKAMGIRVLGRRYLRRLGEGLRTGLTHASG